MGCVRECIDMELKEQVNLFVSELAMQAMEYGKNKGWAMLHPVSIVELTHVIKVCYLIKNKQKLINMSEEERKTVCDLNRQIEECLLLYHVEKKGKDGEDVDLNWWIARENLLREERIRIYLKIYVSCLLQPKDRGVTCFFRRFLFYSEFHLLKTGVESLSAEILQQQEDLQRAWHIQEEWNVCNEENENMDKETVTKFRETDAVFEYYKKYCEKREVKDVKNIQAILQLVREDCLSGEYNWKEQEAENYKNTGKSL